MTKKSDCRWIRIGTRPLGQLLLRCIGMVGASIAMWALTVPAGAQWLNYKTPGIPRTADGKPNLSAPAPRMPDGKPDFSGLWRIDPSGTADTGKAEDAVKPQAWAVTLTEKRKETIGRDSPSVRCLPPGPVVDMGVGKVVQTPALLLMLWNGTLYREIHLDGRELPPDPNPDWMGYSVGHWEGDTLVIVSAGFNDRTWLDDDGHPHTEALRVTERIRRPDFGHLEVVRTFIDPGALLEPWTVPVKLELDADTDQLEYVCNENERDRDHLVGKTSDEKSVKLAPGLLQKYAGTYEFTDPTSGRVFKLVFSLKEDHLVLGGVGASEPLKAVSETEFLGNSGTSFKFIVDGSGAVTQTLIRAVEGDFKAVRK
jgi:hypothetical protein